MQDKLEAERLISKIKVFLESSFWLTPVNLDDEKRKVLQNYKYNPIFKYPDLPIKKIEYFLARVGDLRSGKDENSYEEVILHRKLEEVSLKLQLLLKRGTEEVTHLTLKLYKCGFDEESLNHAERDSKINTQFKRYENLNVSDFASKLRDYLIKYGLKEWNVEMSNLSDFYVRINAFRKTIYVGSNLNWDFADLDNTLAHEVDGHVLRAVNAQKQKEETYRTPLPFYLKTEEGLASFLGDYCSTTSEVSRKHHALKYLAGKLALKEPFNRVFEFLVTNGFTIDLAFQRTFRLKRGFEETSMPGCFAKEAMYYEGMVEVKKFLDEDGNVRKLYSGKFGLRDLEYTPIVAGAIIPERLKKYLDNV